jgi:hypothetical protein
MTAAKAAAADSWLDTSDAVMRGLNHEFSNRLSLARLTPQLGAMLRAGEPALQKLVDESQGTDDMLQLLRLFRLMLFNNGDPAEPVLISDAAVDGVDLFRHHTSFRDLEVQVTADGMIPPTLMNPTGMRQAVLLLLCVAARQLATDAGDGGAIALTFSANADAISVSARVRESGDDHPIVEAPELPALRYLIRGAEGTVDVTRGSATLSIGTLVRLRRREKQR